MLVNIHNCQASIEFPNFTSSGVGAGPDLVAHESVLVNRDGWLKILGLLTDSQKQELYVLGLERQVISHRVHVK